MSLIQILLIFFKNIWGIIFQHLFWLDPSPSLSTLVTNWLTDQLTCSCSWDLTDVTLADEDDYSVLFGADFMIGSEQTKPDTAWFPKTLLSDGDPD